MPKSAKEAEMEKMMKSMEVIIYYCFRPYVLYVDLGHVGFGLYSASLCFRVCQEHPA